jgi:hypothetical protein
VQAVQRPLRVQVVQRPLRVQVVQLLSLGQEA